MVSEKEVYDITIVGGGPAGLFTAFYGGLRNAKVKIIESLPELGGQLTALYPEKYIYDVAGFSKISARKLVERLEEQLTLFPITYCLNETVNEVLRLEDNSFQITTNKGTHFTKTIIIAAGNGAFEPRKLKIDDAEQYEGKNLHYFVKDMQQFKDRRVVVCGGGDSAVDWALMLKSIAKSVKIVHRRDEFRAHEHSVSQLKESTVQIVTPYEPVELVGDGERIERVVLQKPRTDETTELELDDLIVNYGFISKLGPINDWGLEIEKNSIVVNSKLETNLEGIYAVGDINTYPGKVKLIATGFGDAPAAVSNALAYIDPKVRVQPRHSTSIFS